MLGDPLIPLVFVFLLNSIFFAIFQIGASFSLLMTYIWKTSRVAIYIGTCTIGFFLSSMSPSVMAMTEQFVDVNRKLTMLGFINAATVFPTANQIQPILTLELVPLITNSYPNALPTSNNTDRDSYISRPGTHTHTCIYFIHKWCQQSCL